MPAFMDLLSASRKPLWLDYSDYAGVLMSKGSVPWLDIAALIAWQRKAQGLLKSDVMAFPLAAVCAAWLDAHPDLRSAMASKTRTVFAVKTLLADESLRAHLLELARGLRACFADLPLALVCPSPQLWTGLAYQQAHGADTEVEDDDADSAAVYIADFLRSFGDAGVDVLLLQEAGDGNPTSAEALALYQPVLNIAAHYRWAVGLYAPAGVNGAGGSALNFVVAASAQPGVASGCIVPSGYWSGTAAPECPPAGFRYATIPADAQPELVLQHLTGLR